MILPLPYNTDAPLYHWPFATVGLIVLNTIIFGATAGNDEALEALMLEYGHINPLEWITSNFAHAGFFHLAGNMIFLWAFGLVVEGKLGWGRYLLVYLVIGIIQCAIEQTLTLGMDEGGSLGASSIIFGLMVISMIWAPLNEMNCFIFIFRVFVFDLKIIALCGIYLVYNLITGVIIMMLQDHGIGFVITSQVLHFMGGAVGLVVGVYFLKRQWVDCEHWDLFSVRKGHHRLSRDELAELKIANRQPRRERVEKPNPQPQPKQIEIHRLTEDSAISKIRELMALGKPVEAFQVHQQAGKQVLQWRLPESDFIRLIDCFGHNKKWLESIPAMADYLRTYELHADTIRLKLAAVLVQFANRPHEARQLLNQINEFQLSPEQRPVFQNLLQKIQQMT